METLLYFAVFAGLFFLVTRFGCGANIMGHGGHSYRGEDGARDGGYPPMGTARDRYRPRLRDKRPDGWFEVVGLSRQSTTSVQQSTVMPLKLIRSAIPSAKGSTRRESMEHHHG